MNAAPLDPARLDELEADVGPKELAALIDLVLADLPAQHRALEVAVAADDTVAAARAAHTVKSLAALIGAEPVRTDARQIEDLAASGDLAAVRARLGNLGDALATATDQLEARRRGREG